MDEQEACALRDQLRGADITCYTLPNRLKTEWAVIVCSVDRDPLIAIFAGRVLWEGEES